MLQILISGFALLACGFCLQSFNTHITVLIIGRICICHGISAVTYVSIILDAACLAYF